MAINWIEQPLSKGPIVGDSYSVGASVTGQILDTPILDYNSTTKEYIRSVAVDPLTGEAYASGGFGGTGDSQVIKRSLAGVWSLFFDVPSESGVASVFVDSLGNRYTGTERNSGTLTAKIYVNEILRYTSSVKYISASVACFYEFGGDIYVGIGYSTPQILKSTDRGVTWVVVWTGGIDSGTILSFSDLNGVLYASISNVPTGNPNVIESTTGTSWSNSLLSVNTDSSFTLCTVGSNLYAAQTQTPNVWKVFDGTTWTTYSGVKPAKLVTRRMAYNGRTIYFASSTGYYTSRDNMASWQYTTLSSSYESVFNFAFYGADVYVSTGTGTGDGDIWKLSEGTDFKLYKTPSTLIDSKTETDGTYSYSDTADLSDYGSYYLTATNVGTTITSGTFTINPLDIKPMANYDGIPYLF